MSSESLAIRAEHLVKEYAIGRSRTGPSGNREILRALDDVSFDVKRGEVVGIIGRNGAGKSTLLKVLTAITWPDSGEAHIVGRVGSLLEVGTGFHPELTGRENVFLNGAILGMSRRAIDTQFDAIVAFAGVERFMDTPVKRYSSGMYVRLAFAVAAHLDCEILIVDEVLAVGDVEFQAQCLDRIQSLAEEEHRTVLLVSHNMAPMIRLCGRALVLERGRIIEDGDPRTAVSAYLALAATNAVGNGEWNLEQRDDRHQSHELRFTRLRLLTPGSDPKNSFGMGATIEISIRLAATNTSQAFLGLAIVSDLQELVATFTTNVSLTSATEATAVLTIPDHPFAPGRYLIDLGLTRVPGGPLADEIRAAARFDVLPDSAEESDWIANNGAGRVRIPSHWSFNL